MENSMMFHCFHLQPCQHCSNVGIFFLVLVIAITTFIHLKKSNSLKPKKPLLLPSGPKPWPLVGILPTILKNKPVFRWMHKLMQEMDTEIACFRIGNVHVIPVTCPEISCEFLKAQDDVFADRPLTISTHLVTRGYLTTTLVPLGQQWKKMKNLLVTKVFSPAKMKWLHCKRLEEADHLVRYVYNQWKKTGVVDVRMAAKHYVGNVMRKMVFNRRFFADGMKDGGPGFEEEEHFTAIFTALEYIYKFDLSNYLPLMGLDLDVHQKIMKDAIRIIEKYHDPIIDDRVLQWKKGIKKEQEDLLDVLITLKDANGNSLLSTEEIKAQIIEIMMATLDNPSNALEWSLAEMLNQPHILEKAVEELDKVVGKERLVQESDFSHLNYIKACIREAFRLHPVAPFNVPHVSISDTTVANYYIPKGSHVLLSRVGLGRNPKIWDEPHIFKPERHLKKDGSPVTLTESDLRLISFSTGKRGCPGIALGSSVTMMLFARLLQAFSWSLPPDEACFDLTESDNSLALAKSLVAAADPRLPTHLYRV